MRARVTRWAPQEAVFSVHEVPLRATHWGWCYHDEKKIEISDLARGEGAYSETLIHELLHAIFPSWSESAVQVAGVVIDNALRHRPSGDHRRRVIDDALLSVAPHLSARARRQAAADIARAVKAAGV